MALPLYENNKNVFTDVTPNERFFSPDGSAPNHNGPTCSTFCQYTGSPKIRTLRKQETSDEIPFDAALCEPCDSACQLATTIMTPTATTQKQSIPPMSTAIGTSTPVIWIETTQNATKPSTSIEIDSTTDVITTGTTQITSVPSVSTDIDRTITITPQKTTLTGTTIVTCPNPPDVAFATISSQTGSNYNDSITYTCNIGYESTDDTLDRKCNENKLWDGTPPVCSKTNTITTILKRNSGPIVAGGLMSFGFLLIPVVFCCLLKGRSKEKYIDTSSHEVSNSKEDEDYHVYDKPSETYQIYRGR